MQTGLEKEMFHKTIRKVLSEVFSRCFSETALKLLCCGKVAQFPSLYYVSR